MTRYSKLPILALALAMAAVGSTAYAATNNSGNDAQAVSQARISLSQAIAAAEQKIDGTASRAEYENSDHGWVYDVEVVKGNEVFDVKVDPDHGNVVASSKDSNDHDDDHDMKD